ncbi:MAG TPA: hypothetical protein VL500_03205 [Candidatus Eisenbacteria bacterium]|nr:hypothetical protein [Candidatus Eisenbacteria bacterium]
MRPTKHHSHEDLAEANRAITSLIGKLAKAAKKLRKGTPQHTLAKRRLKALRIAAALIGKEAGKH